MQIEFYGVLAEVAGTRKMTLAADEARDVQGVLDALEQRLPALSGHLPRVACAVGDELVMRGETVNAGDTLALLPPVSGG
ncbi:MoaD/ThiS family protein [Ectothiorhodospiraceae bacterium WFHF3C12]|nr:MoaD/ThiS family protein [Ectothiorhodospiraceae bacterium WFHF3C12]